MQPKSADLIKIFPFLLPTVVLLVGIFAANHNLNSLRSQADSGPTRVIVIKPLLHQCNLHYYSCTRQERPGKFDSSLKALAFAYDINPQLILVLASLSGTETDQTTLTDLARHLTAQAKNLDLKTPLILDHPQYGIFRFETAQVTDHLLVRFLLDQNLPPDVLSQTLTSGFIDTYLAQTKSDPRQP